MISPGSRLFGFGGKRKIENNAGKTEVNINGVKVWENGERAVDHNCDEITAGSYTNGITGASDAQYTDGYKDNAFTVTETGWVQRLTARTSGWSRASANTAAIRRP